MSGDQRYFLFLVDHRCAEKKDVGKIHKHLLKFPHANSLLEVLKVEVSSVVVLISLRKKILGGLQCDFLTQSIECSTVPQLRHLSPL